MKLNTLIKITAALVVVFVFTGCDEDYTEIGGEIINNPTDVKLREVEVNAYSQKINSIQTNNLTNYFLGVNNNPVYGESTASIITQLNLSSSNPDFGDNVVLDSVVMTIPYFSHETEESTTDDLKYELDSIFGEGSFKLSIYETSYFLNDLDPAADFEQRQKYYSDQQDIIEQNIVGEAIYQDDNFMPSADTYTTYGVDDNAENDTVVNAPALRIKLPLEYFKQKIIDKEGSDELLNNNNFKNYFRSLYLKAEPNNSEGSQILFSLSDPKAKISIYYTHDSEEEDNGETTTVRSPASYDLNITAGNHFNTYTGSFNESVLQAIESQNEGGSENLYLKGQEGSMAIINLFPDETVLDELRENDWLINEANLIFYVNQDLMNNAVEPERLFLYNVDDNIILADYANDIGALEGDPLNSRLTFSPRLERGEDDKGVFYKIRITEHLKYVLNGDSDNVRLGLVVTGNINNTNLSSVKGIENISRVPASSLLTPNGTVLYGDETSNDDKRLKLRIYYTDYNP